MYGSARDRFLMTFLMLGLFYGSAAIAEEDRMVWTSRQADGGAELSRQVPETDNVQVTASCGENNPDNASAFRVVADTGGLKNGEATRLRFFGDGKEFEFEGRALVPSSEEGFQGIEVVIPYTHALWDAFNSSAAMRYQIPGYQSENLPLADGHKTISDYLSRCRSLVAKGSSGSSTTADSSGAKDAFASARELNTEEGYQAFINAYPTGFYTDLAKGHLKKLRSGAGESQAASPPADEKPLSTYTVGTGSTPWYKTTHNGNPNAAGVQAGGLELIAYCTSKREVGLAVRDFAKGQYPEFGARIRQGLQRDRNADLKFEGEGSFRAMFHASDSSDLNMSYPVATSNGIVRSLMSGRTLHLSQPPFAAIFQLEGSRAALCEALNGCGAETPECPSQNVSPTEQSSDDGERCSSRSVYVKGRGCILKKYVEKSESKKSCSRKQIRVEGKCMTRSEAVSFCGPGYRVRGGKCVHQNEVAKPKPKSNSNGNAQMLKRNEGGFISVADCKRKGMVPEFGYCVEND